jgi:hypothetical protein
MKYLLLLLISISNSFAVTIGDKCPDGQLLKRFDNGSYLLEEDDNVIIHCRQPNKIDSFLVVVGLFTRDSLFNRVEGIRYIKYDHSDYSASEVKEAFYGLVLSKPTMRPDGKYESYNSEYGYYAVSNNKNTIPFVEYQPSTKINLCNKTSTMSFSDYYSVMSFSNDLYSCYEDVFFYTGFLYTREQQLREGNELTSCKSGDDSNCVVDANTPLKEYHLNYYNNIRLNKGRSFRVSVVNGANAIIISSEIGMKMKNQSISKSKPHKHK